jgi:hypothetical protein
MHGEMVKKYQRKFARKIYCTSSYENLSLHSYDTLNRNILLSESTYLCEVNFIKIKYKIYKQRTWYSNKTFAFGKY